KKRDTGATRLDGVDISDDKPLEKELSLALGPEGALVSIDPASFEIRAMVGGYDEVPGGLNRATEARRQPGSTFKPVGYSAALSLKCTDVELPDTGQKEHKCYTPATILRDQILVSQDGSWVPKDADNKEMGDLPMRKSIAQSRNLSTINLAREIKIETVVEY